MPNALRISFRGRLAQARRAEEIMDYAVKMPRHCRYLCAVRHQKDRAIGRAFDSPSRCSR